MAYIARDSCYTKIKQQKRRVRIVVAILCGVFLPWLVFFVYLYLCYRFPTQFKQRGSKKIWTALYLATPFFIVGTMMLAQQSFHRSYIPIYLMTVILLLIFMLGVHLFFFKEIIWHEYIKISLRMMIQVTIVMSLFFTMTSILSIMGLL